MKILIISGSGFVGTNLADILSKNHDVTIVSKYQHKFSSEITGINYVYEDWKHFDYFQLFSVENYDKIFLLGWSDHPRSSNNKIYTSFTENVLTNMHIIDQIVHNTSADIYFLSSFGALPKINSSYSHQLISGYSAGKSSIETYLETFSHIYNRKTVSLRLSNPYGMHQDPNSSQGVVAIFVGNALKKKKINILNGSDLKKDYIYIEDAIKKIVNFLGEPNKTNYFVKEVVSGCKFSVLEIASHINIHLPILDLLPAKLIGEVDEITDKIKDDLNNPEKSDNKIFSKNLVATIDWIQNTNF